MPFLQSIPYTIIIFILNGGDNRVINHNELFQVFC